MWFLEHNRSGLFEVEFAVALLVRPEVPTIKRSGWAAHVLPPLCRSPDGGEPLQYHTCRLLLRGGGIVCGPTAEEEEHTLVGRPNLQYASEAIRRRAIQTHTLLSYYSAPRPAVLHIQWP